MNKLKLEVLIRSEVLPSLVLPFSFFKHAAEYSDFKGKWQQNLLSSHLKETPKQDTDVYYRSFTSALFCDNLLLQ